LNTLLARSITGLLYLLVFIAALLFGEYTFAALFIIINILALREFYRIVEHTGHKPLQVVGIISGTVLYILGFIICSFQKSIELFAGIIPFFLLIFITELYRKNSNPVVNISYTITGIIYVSVPLVFFNYFAFLSHQYYSYKLILGFFILLWTNDTTAYLTGISLGKHKLFKKISPKKSWEGFIGGTLFTLLVAFFLSKFLIILENTDWLIIGVIISVAGVYGDLVESLMKRSIGLKDSGKILPGHGGMLDRIDSVLLSSPLVFMYLVVFK